MVNLIIGKKGTGKTKAMLDSVNNAVDVEHGNVVFISKDSRHMFDVNHGVRLIDIGSLDIASFCAFDGFIKGMIAQNYDITHIYIDSLLKLVKEDYDEIPTFLDNLNNISTKHNIRFTITISADKNELPETIDKYIA